jgi:hypothetical protein
MLYETARETTLTMITIAQQYGFTPGNTVVGELCEGKGAITEVLEEAGYAVIGRDKYFFAEPKQSFDIFADPFPAEVDLIITNPPYDKKEHLVKRLYENGNTFCRRIILLLFIYFLLILIFLSWILGKPFIILFPANAVFNRGCINLFKQYGVKVIIPNTFPKFRRDKVWVRPEKTAFFVGNVGEKIDQNEPVKLTFLEADLQSETSLDAAVEEVDLDESDGDDSSDVSSIGVDK